MQKSNDLQTGGLLLLVSILICAFLTVMVSLPVVRQHFSLPALAAAVDVPKLSDTLPADDSANLTISLDDPRVTEFFPSLAEARQELLRAERMTGPGVNRNSIRTVAGSAAPVSAAVDSATASSPTKVTVAPLQTSSGFDGTSGSHGSGAAWTPTMLAENRSGQGHTTAHHAADRQRASQNSSQHPVQHPAVSPDRIPSGSVYAPITVHPVTVNIDRETLSGQVDELSQRFETRFEQQRQEIQRERDALAAAELATQQKLIIAQLQRLRDQQAQQHLPAASTLDRSQITRIEASMDRLMQSFQSLQTETKTNLQQISDKADRVEVANQVIESYDRALRAQLERLQQFDASTAARVAVNVDDAAGEQTTVADTVPKPVAQVDTNQTSSTSAPEQKVHKHATRHFAPLNSAGPQPDAKPATQYQSLPEEISDDSPTDASQSAQSQKEEKSVRVESVKDTGPLVVLPPPERTTRRMTQSVPLLKLTPPVAANSRSQSAEVQSAPTQEELPSIDLEALIREQSEMPQKVEVAARSALNALPPSEESVEPEKKMVVQQIAPPVGYEHVYRFQLQTVEADAVDGSRPSRECPICGKVHAPSASNSGRSKSGCETEVVNARPVRNAGVRQVSNQTAETAAASATNLQTIHFPPVPPPAEPRAPGEPPSSARRVAVEDRPAQRSSAVRRTTTAHLSPMGHGLNATPETSTRPQRNEQHSKEESSSFMGRLGSGLKRMVGGE